MVLAWHLQMDGSFWGSLHTNLLWSSHLLLSGDHCKTKTPLGNKRGWDKQAREPAFLGRRGLLVDVFMPRCWVLAAHWAWGGPNMSATLLPPSMATAECREQLGHQPLWWEKMNEHWNGSQSSGHSMVLHSRFSPQRNAGYDHSQMTKI